MASIEGALLDFNRLDQLAMADSTIHRLDPRAKVLVTLAFIVSVMSFDRYELATLAPFFIFPVVMVSLGDLPPLYIIKKILLLCPFRLCPLSTTFGYFQYSSHSPSNLLGSFFAILDKFRLTLVTPFILTCKNKGWPKWPTPFFSLSDS